MDNTGKSVAFRGGGFAPQSRRWVGVLIFVALILFVEWGTRACLLPDAALARSQTQRHPGQSQRQ